MGKSGHVARKIAATFASTGTPAFFVHAAEASHGDLGMITSDDVMLMLSWSGETEELTDLIDYSRRFGIVLIAITVNAESTLGKAADIVLAMPQTREACPHNLAPTTSSLMQLALGDALAIALIESRGFTAVDFGVFHPARQARRRAQIHSRRDASRRIRAGDPPRRADVGSDRRNVGQRLRLRRGDRHRRQTLRRRHRRRSCAATCATTCCERRSKGDDRVAENGAARSVGGRSAAMLNASKITALIVVEPDRPVGIVHFHDLLRAGVAVSGSVHLTFATHPAANS